jgi:hypothetical protein
MSKPEEENRGLAGQRVAEQNWHDIYHVAHGVEITRKNISMLERLITNNYITFLK